MRCIPRNPKIVWRQIISFTKIHKGEVYSDNLNLTQRKEFEHLLSGYLVTLNEIKCIDWKGKLRVPHVYYLLEGSYEKFKYKKLEIYSCRLSKIFLDTECLEIKGHFA